MNGAPTLDRDEKKQVTVAELIVMLQALPQGAPLYVDADYGYHQCEGVRKEGDKFFIEIG